MAEKAVMIENYPGFESVSGTALVEKMESHLRKQKIDIELDSVSKISQKQSGFFISTGSGKEFESKAVIVASGSDPRPLEVPGEKEFIGKGVSYCVQCDGPFFANKVVAIIGGGNAGFEASLFLSGLADKIYILESGKEVKADGINQTMALETGKVEIMTEVSVKEIKGKNLVEELVYIDKKTNEEKTLSVNGVFVEIGSIPATSFVKDLVDFNEKDEIVVDPNTSQTKTPGLFAAGDVDCVPFKQIVIAAGEGAKAALSAQKYLQKLKYF
jgi:thioredoxin reductase